MPTASFAKDKQRQPTFTSKIERLWWTTKDYGDGPGLTLNLKREGNDWTQYYSAGKAKGAKITANATKLDCPADWAFNSKTQAARLLNTLMDACEAAGATFDPEDLSSFQGMDCEWVNEPAPTKARPDKTIPVCKAVLVSTTNKKLASEEDATEVAKMVLQAMLDEQDEVNLEEIDAKGLKKYTNGKDFAARKKLADVLTDPAYVASLGFNVNGSVVIQ
jgi:hypothetical protein